MARAKGLTRHNLMLFQGDMDRLKAAHPSLSASEIVRALVRKWLEEHGDKRVLDKVEVDV